MAAPKLKAKKTIQSKTGIKANSNKNRRTSVAKPLKKNLLDQSRNTAYLTYGSNKIEVPKSKLQPVLDLIKSSHSQPNQDYLTTQEVADLLNVSRPFVIKLIQTKALPLGAQKGNRRLILRSEALKYRDKMYLSQSSALDALAEEVEELGMDFYQK